jgi:alkylation response protein AidB-like acyl-CoA dehydrogenase
MNLDFTPEELEFRDEVRTWLHEHVPRDERPDDGPEMREFDLAWQRQQYEGGWAGISWPSEHGGQGLSLVRQMIWHEEYARAGGPYIGVCFVGVNHAGPTLIARANEEQKFFHLPQILRGDVVWCQGFSEPEAGSDLAGLQARGVIDGDELVVTGQKTWTSFAHHADYQELLVRTDPTAPRHRGISWAICDMRSPGIDIRPMMTMAGTRHFCEVFYDQVRIPLANVVGGLNQGWDVAMSTLSFERGTAFMASQVELSRTIECLIDVARTTAGPDGRRPAIQDDEIARQLAAVRSEIAALRAMIYAAISRNARQDAPGPEGSIIRLYHSLTEQRVYRLAMDILGPEGLRLSPRLNSEGWTRSYLKSFSATIAGGSSDIQRNIISERVLGLPRRR